MAKKGIIVFVVLLFSLVTNLFADSIQDKVKDSDLIIVGLVSLDADGHLMPSLCEGLGNCFIIPEVISILKGKVIKKYTPVDSY